MMRNFSEMLLRARSALEFSHGQDPQQTSQPCGVAQCFPSLRLLSQHYSAGAKNCSPKAMMPIAAIQLPLARSAMACQLPLHCRNAIAQAIVNVMVTYPTAVTPEMNSR